MGLDGPTKGALKATALGGSLGAIAVTDVRSAAGTALRGVCLHDAVCEDDAQQIGLRRAPAAADAAPLRDAYESPLTSD